MKKRKPGRPKLKKRGRPFGSENNEQIEYKLDYLKGQVKVHEAMQAIKTLIQFLK